MSDPNANARRMLGIMERLRPLFLGPAFRRLTELQLSPSHHRMLRVLATAHPMAMKDLADRLGLTPPSITALTRRLVATGLVERRAHLDDSRVALLDLTAAGNALYQELMAEQLLGMRRLLDTLSPAEQETLLELLDRAVSGATDGAACDHHRPTSGPPR
ncbi:MAG: MarR family transcriptional regulator [Chloroflexi bacterium OHK40]